MNLIFLRRNALYALALSLLLSVPVMAGVNDPDISVIGMMRTFMTDEPQDVNRDRAQLSFDASEIMADAYLNPYARGTFGIVVTSSVKIAGVLLVFGLLVIPSVAGVLASDRTGARRAVGWIFACVGSAFGLLLAFVLDTAAAPTILIVLTLSLAMHGIVLTGWRRLH